VDPDTLRSILIQGEEICDGITPPRRVIADGEIFERLSEWIIAAYRDGH